MIYTKLPKKFEKWATLAGEFFADFYNIPDEVNIAITAVKDHTHVATAEDFEGENPVFDYGVVFDKAEMKKLTEEEFVKIIGHEITHIKQFMFDGLYFHQDGDVVEFKNELYNLDNYLEYWLAPWETEARGMELGLWHVYVARCTNIALLVA